MSLLLWSAIRLVRHVVNVNFGHAFDLSFANTVASVMTEELNLIKALRMFWTMS